MQRPNICNAAAFGAYCGLTVGFSVASVVDFAMTIKALMITVLGIVAGSLIGAVAGWLQGRFHIPLDAAPEYSAGLEDAIRGI
jgi:ABC-type uncharacterized transport system permease subunit